jgi:putative lumazine-binding protein
MKTLMLVAAIAFLPVAAAAQQRSPEDAAVRKAITDHYFKAHATGSGEPLKGMFVDEGRMMWVQDGQLRSRTSAEYIGGFKGTPAADEARRVRKVLMTDVTGDVAIAKIELDYPDGRFVDYFTLAKLGGEWKIIHKTFQRFPKARRPD